MRRLVRTDRTANLKKELVNGEPDELEKDSAADLLLFFVISDEMPQQ